MNLKKQITYRFAQVVLMLAIFFCLLKTVVVTAHVVQPFRPYVTLWGAVPVGFIDYWKGIPLKASAHTPIPDSSFNIRYQSENGGGSAEYISYYHQFNPYKPQFTNMPGDKITSISGDTVTASFHSRGLEADPASKAVDITELTFYLWPESLATRLLYYLPDPLTWLVIVFCCWQLFKLMQDIVKVRVFERDGYRRVAMIGTSIIALQAVLLLLDFFPPHRSSMNVIFHANILNNHIPFDLSASPAAAFDLTWLAVGCIILVLSRGFQRGNDLQRKDRITI
jgi:Protein of unknown function (DUF2975)